MAIKYRENGQSVTRANIGGGGGSTKITVETPTVTNATPYKYTGSALGPTITWGTSAMANYVNITNATGTAVGQYVLTLALKNPTLSMWDDLTTADKTYNYDIIPDGATATANDVQTLLKCTDIFDKAYTTISEVLADNTSLQTIVADHNAMDYMARSTTWASTVCANETAMSYIGLNDYAADTLLADSTWLTAIRDSAYFYQVLTPLIPTMTSNTTPSGTASASQYNTDAYKAFNNDTSIYWQATEDAQTGWVTYEFPSEVHIYKALVTFSPVSSLNIGYGNALSCRKTGGTYTTVGSKQTITTNYNNNPTKDVSWDVDYTALGFRLNMSVDTKTGAGKYTLQHVRFFQVYGRISSN